MWKIIDAKGRTLYIVASLDMAFDLAALLNRGHWVDCYGADVRSYVP